MIGTIIWNFLVGGLSGVLTVLFAVMNNNVLLTALIRGIISFIVMFVVTFLFRWLLALILLDDEHSQLGDEQQVGNNIDYTTPQQDDILPEMPDTKQDSQQTPEGSNDEQHDGGSDAAPEPADFQAFEPPRIERVDAKAANKPDPHVTAQVIRQLTEN